MKHHTLLTLLLAAFGLGACTAVSSTESRSAVLGEDITLAPGERAVFAEQNLEVQFVRVIEDSRCPHDVTCVWAGEVRVQLAVRSAAGDAQLEVIAGQSAAYDAYSVSLLAVQPERATSAPIPASEYRATLRVER